MGLKWGGADSREIVEMTSKENEAVPLSSSISPDDCKGAVEKWLVQLEEEMRRTVKSVAKKPVLSG